MKRIFQSLFLFALAVVPAIPAAAQNQESKVKASIQAVLDQQVEAWNRGDLEGFMAGYWKSPELVYLSNDKIVKGWQTLLDGYRERFKSANGPEMGKLELTEEQIDLLDTNAALVWGSFRVVTASGSTRGGLYTLVMRKLPEGWRTVYDRTSTAKQ